MDGVRMGAALAAAWRCPWDKPGPSGTPERDRTAAIPGRWPGLRGCNRPPTPPRRFAGAWPAWRGISRLLTFVDLTSQAAFGREIHQHRMPRLLRLLHGLRTPRLPGDLARRGRAKPGSNPTPATPRTAPPPVPFSVKGALDKLAPNPRRQRQHDQEQPSQSTSLPPLAESHISHKAVASMGKPMAILNFSIHAPGLGSSPSQRGWAHKQDERESEPGARRGKNQDDDQGRLRERKGQRRAQKRRGAGRGQHRRQHAVEKRARIPLARCQFHWPRRWRANSG
jgi:hypothetical protein